MTRVLDAMAALILAALVLLFAFSALAASTIHVVDGDTLDLDGVRIRVFNIDAPEVFSPSCAAELQLGVLATGRVRALVAAPADVKAVDFRGLDRYGRTLARVEVDGRDLGEILMGEGLAMPWQGHRYHWCEALKRRSP